MGFSLFRFSSYLVEQRLATDIMYSYGFAEKLLTRPKVHPVSAKSCAQCRQWKCFLATRNRATKTNSNFACQYSSCITHNFGFGLSFFFSFIRVNCWFTLHKNIFFCNLIKCAQQIMHNDEFEELYTRIFVAFGANSK